MTTPSIKGLSCLHCELQEGHARGIPFWFPAWPIFSGLSVSLAPHDVHSKHTALMSLSAMTNFLSMVIKPCSDSLK